jgi:cytochrome c peroxidase
MTRSLVALFAAALAACGEWSQPDGFTEADVQLIESMVLPEDPPVDPSNHWSADDAAAKLGQALFFDTGISEPAGISCAACHDPSAWFIDIASQTKTVSVVLPAGATAPRVTKRNSPSLVNVAHYRWWGWDGRSDSLWMQCGVAYEAAATMAGQRTRIAERIFEMYRDLAARAGMRRDASSDREASYAYKALAAYLAKLNSARSPFDRFAAGDHDALSQDAKKGLKLFIGKAGCIECHNGPAFNGTASARRDDDFFHSVGVAQRGERVQAVDRGRAEGLEVLLGKGLGIYNTGGVYNDSREAGFNRVAGLVAAPDDVGRFRIKSLRNVAQSPPYMHAGQLSTLADVVHFYNVGGDPSGYSGERDRLVQPLGLTDDEERQLVRFLESLTGVAVPDELRCDISATRPPGLSCRGPI